MQYYPLVQQLYTNNAVDMETEHSDMHVYMRMAQTVPSYSVLYE